MSIAIRCDGRDGSCTTLAAKVEDFHLVIMQTHHGQKHLTRISLVELVKELRGGVEITAERRTLLHVSTSAK